jgi:hypothetical protein
VKTLVCKKTKTIAVPSQHFDQIASPPTENKHMTRKWILLKCSLHHSAPLRKSAPKIGDACRDPYSRSCRCRQAIIPLDTRVPRATPPRPQFRRCEVFLSKVLSPSSHSRWRRHIANSPAFTLWNV